MADGILSQQGLRAGRRVRDVHEAPHASTGGQEAAGSHRGEIRNPGSRRIIPKAWGGAFFLAGDAAKEDFLDRLLRAEHFGGLRLFGYAILDNPIHIALEIPPGVNAVLAEDEYLARLCVSARTPRLRLSIG